MQCVSCGFENIPGIANCVRCQSLMNFDSIAIEPPRASGAFWPASLRRWWIRADQFVIDTANAIRAGWRWTPPDDFWQALKGNVLPGLSLAVRQKSLRGWVFLLVWTVVLLITLSSIATGSFAFWIAILAFIHTAAIVSFMQPGPLIEQVRIRAFMGIVVFLGVRFVAYGAVGVFASHFYSPFHVQGVLTSDEIRDGDGLLYKGDWLSKKPFQRGDIVLVRIQQGYYGNGFGPYAYVDGYAIDRIVALPNETVATDGHRLLINGKEQTDILPLGGVGNMGRFSMHLGPSEYAVFPSRLPLAINGNVDVGAFIQPMCRIRKENILGQVVFRLHPFSRFGKVK